MDKILEGSPRSPWYNWLLVGIFDVLGNLNENHQSMIVIKRIEIDIPFHQSLTNSANKIRTKK